MIELYVTHGDPHGILDEKLKTFSLSSADVLKTPSGKPYIKDDPVCFSISHSGGFGAVAICDKPIGVDLQSFVPVGKYAAILSRFFESERKFIGKDGKKFAKVWAAKEAFVKMRGGSILKSFKKIEVRPEGIFFDGEPQKCGIYYHFLPAAAIAVCVDGSFSDDIEKVFTEYIR